MKEVYKNLYVGLEQDYNRIKGQNDWFIVHACKEPFHRQALGYKSQGAPKTHSEYLIAERGNRLILNLVDTPNPAYTPKEIIDKAISFTYSALLNDNKVLIHCNKGESRSPSIAMLYMAIYTDAFSQKSFNEVEKEFQLLYPMYKPAKGIRGFLQQNWEDYLKIAEEDKAKEEVE
jgi:hypothetical protein